MLYQAWPAHIKGGILKERPILFSAPMVRALLAGTKTQTRRILKLRPGFDIEQRDDARTWPWAEHPDGYADLWMPCPYGQPGDRLWVRETFLKADKRATGLPPWVYAADYADCDKPKTRWKPSIHMPRVASRITLEITSVRVQRLWNISEADAMAEGAPLSEGDPCPEPEFQSHTLGFFRLWDSINGPHSWTANPWVWVIDFKRVEQTL